MLKIEDLTEREKDIVEIVLEEISRIFQLGGLYDKSQAKHCMDNRQQESANYFHKRGEVKQNISQDILNYSNGDLDEFDR